MNWGASARAAALAFQCALGCALAAAPQGLPGEDSKPEAFEPVDPYTKGERAALDAAGYVSLGPFPWCEGLTTDAIAAQVGPVLWVETAHFRIGSTLETYRGKSDAEERRRLRAELERIRALFPRSRPEASKLDPWLRLHLYALRLEALRARFVAAFGLDALAFGEPVEDRPAPIAAGPHLGMALKPTVLLCQKRSTLARFLRLALGREGVDPQRERLPGGSSFYGISAEELDAWQQELDLALHTQVAADVALNFVDGFRDAGYDLPLWFKYGWSHVVAREVDERFVFHAQGTQRGELSALRWEERVRGLVENRFAPSFADLARIADYEKFRGPAHLVSWSKVSWLLERGPTAMGAFLAASTEPLPQLAPADRAARVAERQLELLPATAGVADLAAVEEAWRHWAARPPARR